MFYNFRQNNTGGAFALDEDRGISVNVIVEADSTEEANERAQRIGVYFNGCDDGSDCPCCGDRWYEAWGNEGEPVPSIYGKPLIEASNDYPWMGGGPEAYVHLKDGRKFAFHIRDGNYVYLGDPSDLVDALPAPEAKEIEA